MKVICVHAATLCVLGLVWGGPVLASQAGLNVVKVGPSSQAGLNVVSRASSGGFHSAPNVPVKDSSCSDTVSLLDNSCI